MKKIFILFAAALTIGLTGCQSFLEEETYGSTTEIFKEEKRHQGAGIPELHQDQQPLRRRRTVAADDRAGDGHLPARQEPGRCGPVRLLRARRHQRQCGMAVEPLLQGAVQHQPVLRNDRPDALCRRGRKRASSKRRCMSCGLCSCGSSPRRGATATCR